MDKRTIDDLWLRIQKILEPLIASVSSFDNQVSYRTGTSENDAFPMKAFLSFMKSKQGDEIAVTVTIKTRQHRWIIESDICRDDGVVFAQGPTKVFKSNDDSTQLQWLNDFERFIKSNEGLVKTQVQKID